MLCSWPREVADTGVYYPCGKCLHCRINRERIWQHRIVLESIKWPDNCFTTITYNDEHLPEGGNLVPRDMQLFMKRLRKYYSPKKIRFYTVGEYGEKGRPHYHQALFNCNPVDLDKVVDRRMDPDTGKMHAVTKLDEIWGKGHTMVGELNSFSARYLAGYITKGLVREKSEWLEGRHPEFSRMSNRPGIGCETIQDIGRKLDAGGYGGKRVMELRVGKKKWPLGRYLACKLNETTGRSNMDVEKEFWDWHAGLCAEAVVRGKSVWQHLKDDKESDRIAQTRRKEIFSRRRYL